MRHPPPGEVSRGGRRREPDLTVATGQLRRRTASGLFVMGGSSLGQAVLQIVFLSLLARVVAPEQFGLVSGTLIAVYLATALAESGIGAAIVQRAELTVQHVRVGWTLSILFGVACWGALSLLAPYVEDLLRLPGLTPLLRTAALVFVINSLTLSDFLLSRRLGFTRLAIAELVAYTVGYGVLAVTLAYLGYGAWAIVFGQIGQSAVRAVIVTCMAPFPYRLSLARQPVKELLNFGGGFTLGRIAQWGATQMDNVVVGRYLGAAALGLYGRAYQLVQMPANLLGQVANQVLFPAMASVQTQQATLRRVFRLGVSSLAAAALPVSVLAAITSEPLVLVLLGPDWLPLRAAFDVIIFGLLFRTSTKLSDALLKARGAVYRRALLNTVFAGLVFAGAYGGHHWGLHGVAIGVLIALGVNHLLTSRLCLQLVSMTWADFLRAHVPALLLSAVAGGVGLGVHLAIATWDPPSLIHLLLVWAAAGAACAITVRMAWRTRALASIATLVCAVLAMMPGRASVAAGRLLGPGYAARLAERPGRAPSPAGAAPPATDPGPPTDDKRAE